MKQENYALELDIASDWEIPLGSVSLLPLKNLQINLEIDNSGVFATIDCVLNIAEVDIILLAMHGNESGATGWTFEGSTRRGQELPIGKLMKDLATLFGITEEFPSALEEIIIENLKVYFNTVNKDFYFTCEAEFPLNDEQVDIIVNLNITRQQDGSYKKHFDGHITIGSLKFALIFDTDRTSTNFLAAYHDDQTIKIKDLIGYIDSQLKDDIPEGLEINLKDALFAYSKQPTLTNFLFGLNIDGGINLSNLPLVGREFPPNQTLKISLQVLVTKANFTATELQTFNTLYTEGGIQLPTTDINQRLDLIPSIQLGSELKQLELPITINKQSGQIEGTTPARNNNLPSSVVTPSSSPTQIGDSTTYFTLQKSFGPAHVERIGLKYQDSKIWVLLDASLSLAGLTLTLDGLSVSSPLTTFDPQFNLHGIGIDYQGSGTVTIGGAFLKQGDEYSGTAFIKTADLTLSAVGSYYTPPHGDPSLFIYALLNKPIGGPAFFFVTGLAAAFGYNRALTLPTIEQVAIFPLIQAAISSTGSPTDLSGMLRNLDTYIKPATGEVFIAVGVKFTSFKLIDSFALLIATFGDPFELHILGLSTLITPTPEAGKTVTPLAEVQMALKATFIPEQGFLAVNAQLTPSSYIFSKACHLVGGFAYYSWFSGEHAGDFVITLGGYHPDFNVPTHYPQVPRLGFNWQVDDHLTIKGDAYYALTPAALMAGGHLQARWESGPLSAWFNAGANFLIAWKPYHYEASISVDMGVSYTFEVYLWFTTIHKTISVDIGADLQIWGPDFSGIAHIHLWIISFDVSFGSSSSQQPQAIDWTTFKASFLPADDQICSIVVKDGLVKEIKSEHPTAEEVQHLGVINPKHFSLITNSIIPSNQAKHATEENYFIPFGIAPMDLRADSGFTSTHTITITRRENNTEKHVENEFKFTPILKNMPSGLWGNIFHPDLNAPQTINNLLSGFEITPGTPPEPGQTQEISSDLLQDAPSTLNDAYHLNKLSSFAAEPLENTLRVDKINQTLSDCPTRTTLLQALGFSADEIDLHSSIAYDFLVPPQIGTLTPLAA
ncbi:MAG TPA: hypothetical protein DCP31_02885 [Cyanobacteria bacterium UBA8543]|nr:hypothetical protein [Cyanobacteria bacterium UBA8543]